MEQTVLLLVYSVLIVLSSLGGGALSKAITMTHLRTQLLMSAVGGLMIGIALMHLLPEAIHTVGSPNRVGAFTLAGLISMFLVIRLFHTHDHGAVEHAAMEDAVAEHADVETGFSTNQTPWPDGSEHAALAGVAGVAVAAMKRGHVEARPHCDHEHPGPCHTHEHHSKSLGWAGLFFGMALHTVIDGVALAASVLAATPHQAWLGLAGLGTFLAIVLHKPLDAFAVTSVMKRQGWSDAAQRRASAAFSVCCPVGALVFYAGVSSLSDSSTVVGLALAVAAGFFICIALADLLPEVAFHDHDRGKLTAALLLGVAVAVAIENLPGHTHEHPHPHADASHLGP